MSLVWRPSVATIPLVLILAQAAATETTDGDTAALVASRPVVRHVVVRGLEHTRSAIVRRQIAVTEGDTLDESMLRRMRRRLEETGLFGGVDVSATAAGPGRADLVVALTERHGFGVPVELIGRAVVDLSKGRITARYANVAGVGLTLGGWYRWERTQPSAGLRLDAVDPFGLGANLSLEALGARPTYDLDDGLDPFTLRTRGADLGLRRVVGSRTAAGVGLRYRERRYTVARPDTIPGRVLGLQVALDHRFLDGPRHRLEVGVLALTASPLWGSDLDFTRGVARLAYRAVLGLPEPRVPVQRSEVAVQLQLARAGERTPLDEMFAPGAASEMPFPLRAHRQKRSGVLGRAPIGRTLALANFEARQRLYRCSAVQIGAALFYDVGRIGHRADGETAILHDVGAGLRVGLGRSTLLRADFGYGVTDGKTALTAGVGQVF
jgi:hypothetical protein